MITLPHLASRIFDTPLAIHRQKLEVIVQAIGPRLQGIPMMPMDQERMRRKPYMVTPDGIAVIDIMGTLVHRSTGMDALSGLTSYGDIEAELIDAVTDPAITGVILNIDSPGGEVQGMFDLADEIYSARDLKPICAVADSAYSAAYLLASAAGEIYTPRTGGAGSVGIICLHLDQSAADAKDGLKYTAIYAGSHKNDGNPHEPLTDAALARIQADVTQLDGMFAAMVARNRGMKPEAITGMEAMTYMGDKCISNGLADKIGTLTDCMAAMTQKIRMPMKSGVQSAQTSSVASATENREVKRMADTPVTAEAKVPTPAEIEAQVQAARESGAVEASAIVDLCAIAGKPGLAAGFLAGKLTRAQVSAELLKQRAADSGPETASHILPDAGTNTEAKPSQSAIVKACEALAKSQGGK